MKKIIYTRPDGGLSVVHPAISMEDPADFTEERALERAWKDVPKDAIEPQVMDMSLIPTDRTFRDAWKAGAGKVVHDIAKAREIKRNQLRVLRAPKLLALDVAFMRALERGDTKACAEIAAQKQALRDITEYPLIDSAANIEELKAVVPPALTQ